MAERDFLDMTEKTQKEDPMDFSTSDFFNPGRTRVNDFKKTANSVNRGGNAMDNAKDAFRAPPLPASGGETAVSQGFGDEKIVWVGAIFVFFGVLVFLVGFWLGKKTIADIRPANVTYQERKAELAQQSKVETQLVTGVVTPEALRDNAATAPVVVNPVTVTAVSGNPVAAERRDEPADTPVRTEAKKVETVVKVEPKKDVKKVTAPVVKPAVAVESKKGDFTLQISAHTSMDKARFIEDQMRAMGMSAYIVEATVNGTTYYRVRVGRFGSKADADGALAKVKASPYGKESFLLNLN